jgi:mRNA interferase HigB
MRIIAKKSLVKYWEKYPDTEQPLKAWYQEANDATWAGPQDIKNQYRNVSIVGNNRVVFNVKGNTHRLIVALAYKQGIIFIKFIGTHEEYDRVNAGTVEWSD